MKRLFIALLTVLAVSCVPTREKCYRLYPPDTGIKDSTWVTFAPDSLRQNADSSWSQYQVECEQTAQGLRARIVRLLSQINGQYVTAPVSVIDSSGTLTTIAVKPAVVIRYEVRTIHSQSVKSSVYTKITNILTGWQWFLIYFAYICMGLIVLIAAYFVIKAGTKKVSWITVVIGLIGKLFKKKT